MQISDIVLSFSSPATLKFDWLNRDLKGLQASVVLLLHRLKDGGGLEDLVMLEHLYLHNSISAKVRDRCCCVPGSENSG